jgi:hypothetical protein
MLNSNCIVTDEDEDDDAEYASLTGNQQLEASNGPLLVALQPFNSLTARAMHDRVRRPH